MLKLGLENLVKFGIVLVGKNRLGNSKIESLQKAYNIRNNIIHNNAQRFKVSEVIKSIETVEERIEIIEQLH